MRRQAICESVLYASRRCKSKLAQQRSGWFFSSLLSLLLYKKDNMLWLKTHALENQSRCFNRGICRYGKLAILSLAGTLLYTV